MKIKRTRYHGSLGYSKARIEKDKHVWAVTIKSGDLLRVLDALEGKQ